MKVKIFLALLLLTTAIFVVVLLDQTTPKVGQLPAPNLSQPETKVDTEAESPAKISGEASTTNPLPSNMPTGTATTSIPEQPSDVVSEPEAVTTIKEPTTMAWIYPSEPGCNAAVEYKDGRKIDILKPEFFTVNGGSLSLFDTTNSSCNGYSKSFVADLKKHSTEQYVTVSSASAADMEIFLNSALATPDDINTLVNFVVENNLTGIELDFEDFGGWSKQAYKNYLLFVESLGTYLHANNKKLMLDAPAIADSTEQGWFAWRYEDFTALPVDHIVLMAYDYQFDHGTGEPVAPLEWIKKVTTWASARYPKSKLSIGIPSYGYEGVVGKRPYIRTYSQLKNKAGFANATRDESSGEMTWTSGSTVYFYQDKESLRQKIKVVTDMGITSVSVWHLGGNVWFK